MHTRVITSDLRKQTVPTFEDVSIGSIFTEPDSTNIYIKMRKCKCDDLALAFNAVCLDGDTAWFYDDEEIEFVKEIAITIN